MTERGLRQPCTWHLILAATRALLDNCFTVGLAVNSRTLHDEQCLGQCCAAPLR